MAFNKFNETNETKENPDNKEASTEKTEKRHNQILEGAYDYKDEFESKVENSEGKEAQDTKENQKKSDGDSEPKKGRKEEFMDRIKVTQSPEEIKKRLEGLDNEN